MKLALMKCCSLEAVRFCKVLLAAVLALTAPGCAQQQRTKVLETAYVRSGDVPLRDQLGPTSNLVTTLDAGQKVEVLDKRARWVQIRLADGKTGWVHSRMLASQELFDQFRRLLDDTASLNSQGKATIRRAANLHLEPDGRTESLHRLLEEELVDVLAHRVAERSGPPGQGSKMGNAELQQDDTAQIQISRYEDWMLVRASGRRAGWVRESSLDMAPPIEIARYNEELRIRAWFVLYQEQNKGETHPWYLWATIHPQPGLPFDYDEIRIFVWNPGKSRYETSYRERNLIGFYPVKISMVNSPAGPTPAFSLELEDTAGRRFHKNYVMAGRLVKALP